MEKQESRPALTDSTLPRPVVLRPEDLAKVAAAGVVALAPTVASRIIIAGGIPVLPYSSAATMS